MDCAWLCRDRLEANPSTAYPRESCEGRTTYKLISVIVNIARACGGLSKQKIKEGLMMFGANGVSTFQITKSGVTMQLIH